MKQPTILSLLLLLLVKSSLLLCTKNTCAAFLFPTTATTLTTRRRNHQPAGKPIITTRSTITTTTRGSAEALGELSAPDPPNLNPKLIQAAHTKLWWEEEEEEEEENQPKSSSSSWENGQVWNKTRQTLIKLWILPRDMSNGAASHYATAASKAEMRILEEVPQLLRMESEVVVESAKTILGTGIIGDGGFGGLPPALVRAEPILLTFSKDCIRGGMELLYAEADVDDNENHENDNDNDMSKNNDAKRRKKVLEACRDTPGLLHKSIEKWIRMNKKRPLQDDTN